MATNFYMKLDNIDGEARDTDHSKEIEILDFTFGVSNTGSRHGGSGGGSGQAHVQDIGFTKYADKSSPILMQYCVSHKDIPNAKITCYKAAGDERVKYLVIELKEVLVTSYQTGGGDGIAMENGSLNFAEIKYVYSEQKTDQGPGGAVEWAYNIPEHKAK
jgi:type VI secretion system secreted protein Hcp